MCIYVICIWKERPKRSASLIELENVESCDVKATQAVESSPTMGNHLQLRDARLSSICEDSMLDGLDKKP